MITEKSKAAFEAAAQKLNIGTDLPDVSKIRPDLGLWLTANFMLAVIIEAGKDGKVYDITNHTHVKYTPWHCASNGYEPGSGGGFSYYDYDFGRTITDVGARLSYNSGEQANQTAKAFPDLYEIIILNVKPLPF